MRLALALIAAVGALALGLTAPAVAQAAAVTPDGQALLRIDGGTAYAKELGTLEYRIKAPKGASVTWLGKARGRTDTGSLSAKALVAGWSKLGHKAGATATTTLTWADSPSSIPTFVKAVIGNPRINAKGELTFLAVTRTALPPAMPNFSINVEWAQPAAATRWPAQTTAFPIDDPTTPTATVQAYVPSNSTATTTFYSVSSSGVSTACANSSYTIKLAQKPTTAKIATATCGNVTIQSQYTSNGVTVNSLVSGTTAVFPAEGYVTVGFAYTPTGKGTFAFAATLATYDINGIDEG